MFNGTFTFPRLCFTVRRNRAPSGRYCTIALCSLSGAYKALVPFLLVFVGTISGMISRLFSQKLNGIPTMLVIFVYGSIAANALHNTRSRSNPFAFCFQPTLIFDLYTMKFKLPSRGGAYTCTLSLPESATNSQPFMLTSRSVGLLNSYGWLPNMPNCNISVPSRAYL